jgi:hypothetical protein
MRLQINFNFPLVGAFAPNVLNRLSKKQLLEEIGFKAIFLKRTCR